MDNKQENNDFEINSENEADTDSCETAPAEDVSCEDSVSSDSDNKTENILRQKTGKRFLVGGVIIIGVVIALLLYFTSDSYKYGQAKDLIAEGKFDEAINAFEKLGSYEDSENKIIECNRRKLYDYLSEKDGYTLQNADYTYELNPEGDKIRFGISSSKQKFYILFDMTSDNGNFLCEFVLSPEQITTSKGKCSISKLKSSNNSLVIDENTGYFNASQMNDLADISCDSICKEFDTMLKKLKLNLSPANLGFAGIE